MAIRWRLTIWFSLILCLLMIFTGVFVYSWVNEHLRDEVDNTLREYSEWVSIFITVDQSDQFSVDTVLEEFSIVDEFSSPGVYFQLVSKQGDVLVTSHNLVGLEMPADPSLIEGALQGQTPLGTVSTEEGTKLRIIASPIIVQDEILILETGKSLKHVDDTMDRIRVGFIVAGLTAVFIALISGLLLARRAFSPVKRVTLTAKRITEHSDLTQRVGYKGPMDEVGHLAKTFDDMIERLRQVFESQEEFVQNASHDLRSPLAVLRMNLDLLAQNLSEQDRKDSLRMMKEEAIWMTRIVDDLLFLAEVSTIATAQNQERVSLRDMVNDGVGTARQSGGNRRILTDIQEDLFTTGNLPRLKRLLANLLENAIKYTSEEGTIFVSLYRESDMACLEVSDDGVGIEADDLPHIFDRFFRADKSRLREKGSGLGLAIVKAIAVQHGGTASAKSEVGRGSTFTVKLRLASNLRPAHSV